MRETETEEALLEVRALEIKGLGIAVRVCWRESSNNDEKADRHGHHSAIATQKSKVKTLISHSCNCRVYAAGEIRVKWTMVNRPK